MGDKSPKAKQRDDKQKKSAGQKQAAVAQAKQPKSQANSAKKK